jgi:hypothetical protein
MTITSANELSETRTGFFLTKLTAFCIVIFELLIEVSLTDETTSKTAGFNEKLLPHFSQNL